MADDFGIYDLSGRLELTVSSSVETALRPVSGNINLRRKPERLARDVAEIRAVRSSSTNFMNVFVVPEVSSSRHEVTSVNAYLSGVVGLESTAVPASGSLFYSKQNRLVSRTFYLTASAVLPTIPAAQDQSPATDEYASRSTFLTLSGSYRNTTIFNPSVFEFNVPNRGKIRNVRVWLEFIHDHRGGPGTGSFGGNPFLAGGSGSAVEYKKQGLQGVQVALRSPNVTFDYAHPLWNDPTVKNFEKWPTSEVNPRYRQVPDLLKSSYLLWAGHACEEDLGYALGTHTGSNASSSFNIRNITSSSFGAGISGSDDTDSNRQYTVGSVFPSYRTLACTPFGFTSPDGDDFVGVMYPTVQDAALPTKHEMVFLQDTETQVEPVNNDQMFIFHTHSFTDFTTEGRHHSARLRIQKDSDIIHGACFNNGINVVYGMKKPGDPNFRAWRLKSPIISDGDVENFPDITGGTDTFTGDSFMDFALDSNGKPHFVTNVWRGDYGITVLNYFFFSGSTADYNATPASTTFINNDGDAIYPKSYNIYKRTGAATADLYPDVMYGQLDNPQFNQGSTAHTAGMPGSVGPYCRVEIDKNDVIHTVYVDTLNRGIKYAKKRVAYTQWSGSWDIQVVHTHSLSSTWPTYLSLDLDASGMPHIAWSLFDGVTDNLYYATSGSDSGWAVQRVASIPSVKFGTNIRLDFNDEPVIISIVSDNDGSGHEGVVMFKSSSEVGWTKRMVYLGVNDDPRDTAFYFDTQNRLRLYTGGRRLTGIWEVGPTENSNYFEYDTDIDMRTIFTDSSVNANPRHLTHLYPEASDIAPGSSSQPGTLIADARAYPSPFSSSIRILQTAGVWGTGESHVFDPTLTLTTHLSGANAPWMYDSRVKAGIFHPLNHTNIAAALTSSIGTAPPPGWLTGPGGTANENEFPTVGPNLGPTDIRPVYPLLDDVFVEKIFDQPWLNNSTTSTTGLNPFLPTQRNRIVGFRPGLRGTEVNGTWKLLIGVAGDAFGGNVTGSARAGVWFRQARLEFLLDEGEAPRPMIPSKAFRFRKAGTPRKDGRHRFHIVSGSAAWDVGINYVFLKSDPEYGRSFGITDVTGSNQFAVFSQMTGTLVSILSSSGDLSDVQASYLQNEFGTPYIPISAGSAEIPSFDTFSLEEARLTREIFTKTLNPSTLIPRDNTLRATLARADVLKSTRDSILESVDLAADIESGDPITTE